MGERGGGAEGAGVVEAHRKLKGTAAVTTTPMSHSYGLGALNFGEEEGNERGEAGLIIESKMARNPALKRRQSRPEIVLVPGAGSSREEDDGDVIADVV